MNLIFKSAVRILFNFRNFMASVSFPFPVYALGDDKSGYPAFIEEAATSAAQDWTQEESTEDTTKIVCRAIPTNFEIMIPSALIHRNSSNPQVREESNIPMVGEKVRMLDADWTGRLVNRGLYDLQDKTIVIGTLLRSPEINVLTLWEDLVRTHFGIFAFTNAGKSNLVSTCTSKMLERSENLKIVVYDLMGKYGVLLIDKLIDVEDSCIACLTPETIPNSVFQYMQDEDPNNLRIAATDLVNTILFPKAIKRQQQLFIEPIEQLLLMGKIKLFEEADSTIGQIIEDSKGDFKSNMGNNGPRFNQFVNNLAQRHMNTPPSEINVADILTEIDAFVNILQQGDQHRGRSVTPTLQTNIDTLRSSINDTLQHLNQVSRVRKRSRIRMSEIVSSLNNSRSRSLFVVQSNLESDLRQFTNSLGNVMLRSRRQSGQFSPAVSFIYDEADSFIPDRPQEDGQGESRSMAQELARRGRKYGLGIGIATQRIVYLDSSVLGQPHTYFVSKLPVFCVGSGCFLF